MKQSKIKKTHLFGGTRDYAHVREAERTFFKSLIKMQNDLSSTGNLSIIRAISDAGQFVQANQDYPLDIIVDFDIPDCRDRLNADKLYLGTKLKPSRKPHEALVTHFMALASRNRLVAKIHIDLDFNIMASEAKPSPHFQGGGRIPDALRVNHAEEPFWDTDIDKPRVPSLPFCTPLLWHSAFLEFAECAQIQAFLKYTWWSNLVKTAERDLWAQFFVDGYTLINGSRCVLDALYRPTER